MASLQVVHLIRPSGTFSHEGRRETRWLVGLGATLLPSWEKVDRAQRETDEGVLAL